MPDHIGGDSARIGEIGLGWHNTLRGANLPISIADRAGLFRGGIGFGEGGVELVSAAGGG